MAFLVFHLRRLGQARSEGGLSYQGASPMPADIILSFTGTRQPLTKYQMRKMRQIICHPRVLELHHGDCVGADAYAHKLALMVGKHIVIHPPVNPKYRAWCMGIDVEWWPEKSYWVRNRDIVRCGHLLLAVPAGPEVQRGSGTWHAIRFARRWRAMHPDYRIRRLMPDDPHSIQR
jgi:hypothetical protein